MVGNLDKTAMGEFTKEEAAWLHMELAWQVWREAKKPHRPKVTPAEVPGSAHGAALGSGVGRSLFQHKEDPCCSASDPKLSLWFHTGIALTFWCPWLGVMQCRDILMSISPAQVGCSPSSKPPAPCKGGSFQSQLCLHSRALDPSAWGNNTAMQDKHSHTGNNHLLQPKQSKGHQIFL